MSFNNELLRQYIVNNFLKEQISIEKSKSLNENELDSFIEMPIIEKTIAEEKTEPKSEPKSDYKYLDNDILSKEFCFNREREILEMKKYMISLCFFNINEELKTPFLEFLFDNQTGEFSFPKKELQMDVLANLYRKENEKKINIENTTPFQKMNTITEDEDETNETDIETLCDDVEIEFFNQCSKFAQEIVFLTDDVIKQRYLGFIEKDDILYLVIDITNINILENIHNNNKNGYFIGIIDEIINRKKIFETPINEKIIDLFESSPLLKNIYDYNNKETIIPKLVYLCVDIDEDIDEDQYTNNENKTESINIEEKPIIIETNNNYIKEKSDIVNTQSPFVENKIENNPVVNNPVVNNKEEVSKTIEIIEKQPVQPLEQQPVQPPIQPPEQQPVQPPEQQPVQQPVQPPEQQPVQPPEQQPVQPPVQPELQPPEQPPEQQTPVQQPTTQPSSKYKNLYYETNDTINSQSPILSIINPKVNHPLFDYVYLFTSDPFIKDSQKGIVQEFISSVVNNKSSEINKIKRYALEIDSVKYYKDVDVETLIEKNEIITPNYDVYCFYEDNREYWAVKSINNFTEI